MKTYHLLTYGCQMNVSDSEKIASYLESNNFKSAPLKQAKFVILNLCSVRQKAVDRIWGKINQIKKENPKAKIILTGCILSDDKKKLKNKVSHILDIKDLANWPFVKKVTNYPSNTAGRQLPITNYFCIPSKHGSKFQAYIPIMNGCNNFCAYCVVPYTRGREKSRSAEEIIDEVNKLIVQGYKHIILLGQNVNSYKDEKNNFPKLLKKIDEIPGDYWLSFVTSHPKDLSDELIKCFKECQHLIPYLHLPIQSGSDKILNAMHRKYTSEKYLDLIKKIRKLFANISIPISVSTDVIVGFPGETKQDFDDTKKIMGKVKFDMAYISEYSTRAGTAATKLQDNITNSAKKKRKKELTEILKMTALENNQKMIGKQVEVLVESIRVNQRFNPRESALSRESALFGKTRNFKNIKISLPSPFPEVSSPSDLIGKIVKVKITKASAWNLQGCICSELDRTK